MRVGPVSFPATSEILGIVILVVLTLYAVNHLPSVKSRVNP